MAVIDKLTDNNFDAFMIVLRVKLNLHDLVKLAELTGSDPLPHLLAFHEVATDLVEIAEQQQREPVVIENKIQNVLVDDMRRALDVLDTEEGKMKVITLVRRAGFRR